MNKRICGNEYRTTMVYINSYNDKNPIGYFYNPYFGCNKSFVSIMDLLIQMEDMLNEMNFPQSFNSVRSFSMSNKLNNEESHLNKLNGKIATFAIKIMFRQNTSWQGSVVWLDNKSEENFRSVLELLFLIDSACNSK